MGMDAYIPAPLFLTGVFFLGLMIGSFLNVVILRLPRRLEYDWKCQCRELLEQPTATAEAPPPGIVWGRSACPVCGHVISSWENIPLISWLLLRGKCKGCSNAISLRYPLVELLTAVLFTITAWHFGFSWSCLYALLFTAVLIALAGIDLDHQLLPDSLTLPLLWGGLIISLWGTFLGPAAAITGAAVGYLSLWTIFQLFRLITGKEGMGYGDFKLMGALGAWMGWQMLPIIILFSSLVGAIAGLGLIAAKKHKGGQPLPFGPFIAAAGWIAFLWGEEILTRYLQFSGIQ